MLRKLAFVALALGVLGLIGACGDDSKPTKQDKSSTASDGSVTIPDQETNPQVDQSTTPQPDGSGGGVCPSPWQAKANSGKICTQAGDCTSDETCVAFKAGATSGMCIGRCCPNTANPSDTINLCPVADSTKQFSGCFIQTADPQTSKPNGYACAWICSVTQSGQTKTYDCPNATDYSCEALNPSEPDVKYCIPK